MIRLTISLSDRPEKGRSPYSASYSTTQNENWSLRMNTTSSGIGSGTSSSPAAAAFFCLGLVCLARIIYSIKVPINDFLSLGGLHPLLMMGFTKLQVSQREATASRASRVAVWGAQPPGLQAALTVEGKEYKLGPGSYFALTNKVPHIAKVEGNEDAVFFIQSDGPWDVVMAK